MSCPDEGETLMHAYVDGELRGGDREAYERHLGGCPRCRATIRFQGRFKAAVRGLMPRRPVPPALEHRIRVALAHQPAYARRWAWLTAPRLLTAGATLAAAAVLAVYVTRPHRTSVSNQARVSYLAELPFDIAGKDCRTIADWFRGRLNFPVPAPTLAGAATCQGGRLVNVEDRLAAYVVYQEPNGHRVSVLVFDPSATPIETPHRRVVNGREVYYGRGSGVSTVAFHDDDLGYVVTSDQDEESLTRLVSATWLH